MAMGCIASVGGSFAWVTRNGCQTQQSSFASSKASRASCELPEWISGASRSTDPPANSSAVSIDEHSIVACGGKLQLLILKFLVHNHALDHGHSHRCRDGCANTPLDGRIEFESLRLRPYPNRPGAPKS